MKDAEGSNGRAKKAGETVAEDAAEAAKKSHPVRHGYYLIYLVLLMLASTLLFLPVIWLTVFRYVGAGTAYGLYVMSGLIYGYLAMLAVKNVMHREKNELLAGMVIPLPSVILLTAFLRMFMETGMDTSVASPITAGLVFYVSFNIRFVMEYFDHHKHKHYIGLYLVAPILLLTSSVLVDYAVQTYAWPVETELHETLEDSGTVLVRDHIESCIRELAEEKTDISVFLLLDDEARELEREIEQHVDENLPQCIKLERFESQGYEIKVSDPHTQAVVGESDISVDVNMSTAIIREDTVQRIKGYFVRLKQDGRP
ncbi:hypothetical protein GF351_02745 [Candidatus Woesearchaeota archaeon]|nr:hypothetical protein [Candidatus Woesearchaeota archaeon]